MYVIVKTESSNQINRGLLIITTTAKENNTFYLFREHGVK